MILRPAAPAPGYTTVSLAAALDVTRTFTVFGRLDNLFDRRYQNPVGFLQPAFGVFAGIRASYSAGERVALRPVLSGRGPTPPNMLNVLGHHCLRWERAIAGDRVIY